ncbi:ATP-binding protein [Nonomuraea endophytica]|uniref:ATP-binding protein n=1 Tax=Nonomuraea endophytica TaxID=714136 RepID=UPI0037C63F6A
MVVLSGFRLEWPITDDLVTLREYVRAFGTGAGLSGGRLVDLVITASEAATQVLKHGQGGRLIAWSDAEGVSLEVVDEAGVLTRAVLARDPAPDPFTWRGIGIWLMRRLCDEVSVDLSDGTARVHLRFRKAGTPAPCPRNRSHHKAPQSLTASHHRQRQLPVRRPAARF